MMKSGMPQEEGNLVKQEDEMQTDALELPASMQFLMRAGFSIEVTNPDSYARNSSTQIYCEDKIQAKIKSGKLKRILKLDFDGTVSTKKDHSCRQPGLGLKKIYEDKSVEINEPETIKALLKLALREDTLLICNSNSPFAFVPFHTFYKLLEGETNRDEILQNIPTITGSPSSVISTSLEPKPMDLLISKVETFFKLWQMHQDAIPNMYIIAKGYYFTEFLTKMKLFEAGYDDKAIELYTIDDSRRELTADLDFFQLYAVFNHITVNVETDLVSDNYFPPSIRELVKLATVMSESMQENRYRQFSTEGSAQTVVDSAETANETEQKPRQIKFY